MGRLEVDVVPQINININGSMGGISATSKYGRFSAWQVYHIGCSESVLHLFACGRKKDTPRTKALSSSQTWLAGKPPVKSCTLMAQRLEYMCLKPHLEYKIVAN